jgi:hypothetical protein
MRILMNAASFVPLIAVALQAFLFVNERGRPFAILSGKVCGFFSLNRDDTSNPVPTIGRRFDAAESAFRTISIHDIDFSCE